VPTLSLGASAQAAAMAITRAPPKERRIAKNRLTCRTLSVLGQSRACGRNRFQFRWPLLSQFRMSQCWHGKAAV
jgi:hypothetical protein